MDRRLSIDTESECRTINNDDDLYRNRHHIRLHRNGNFYGNSKTGTSYTRYNSK